MNFVLPKLPGYKISHDPTKFDFKRVSSSILENNRYDDNKLTKSVTVPNHYYDPLEIKVRSDKSKSVTQSVYSNPNGPDLIEQFQPHWSKLDRKVKAITYLGFKILGIFQGDC